MNIVILTLFPGMFDGPFSESIIKRAVEKEHVSIDVVNFRDYSTNKHKTVDDIPYGGGAGMVIKPEPLFAAVEDIQQRFETPAEIILMTPQGEPLKQNVVNEVAQHSNLIIICGRYEGVDERVREELVDREISVGDYVLTGGELPAMVLVDAMVRMIPGVLGNSDTHQDESFYDGLLEYPQYTRPENFRGMNVPPVLLSGHHGDIEAWRKDQAIKRTKERRPDLMQTEE